MSWLSSKNVIVMNTASWSLYILSNSYAMVCFTPYLPVMKFCKCSINNLGCPQYFLTAVNILVLCRRWLLNCFFRINSYKGTCQISLQKGILFCFTKLYTYQENMKIGIPLFKNGLRESMIFAKLKDNEFHNNFHYINHQGHKIKIFIEPFIPLVSYILSLV